MTFSLFLCTVSLEAKKKASVSRKYDWNELNEVPSHQHFLFSFSDSCFYESKKKKKKLKERFCFEIIVCRISHDNNSSHRNGIPPKNKKILL